MIKPLKKLGIEGHLFNLIKVSTNKLRARYFSIRSRTRQGPLVSPFLFNIVLGVLTRAIRTKKTKRNLKYLY